MNTYVYILIMTLTTFAIRVLPLTVIRRKITNRFLRSFLYYVPYVTLAVMTFPAIVEVTEQPLAGAVALIAGLIAAWFGVSLLNVSVICCAVVFLIEFIMRFI